MGVNYPLTLMIIGFDTHPYGKIKAMFQTTNQDITNWLSQTSNFSENNKASGIAGIADIPFWSSPFREHTDSYIPIVSYIIYL